MLITDFKHKKKIYNKYIYRKCLYINTCIILNKNNCIIVLIVFLATS